MEENGQREQPCRAEAMRGQQVRVQVSQRHEGCQPHPENPEQPHPVVNKPNIGESAKSTATLRMLEKSQRQHTRLGCSGSTDSASPISCQKKNQVSYI